MSEYISDALGICVKDLNKKVIRQNDICLNICGQKVNDICLEGCMKNYNTDLPSALKDGMTLFQNVDNNGNIIDTVVINDGKNLTTLIYNKNQQNHLIQQNLEEMKNYGLTKSELIIVGMKLNGKKNKEIAQTLFISDTTLKTHLNNIYKKLPEKWQLIKNKK